MGRVGVELGRARDTGTHGRKHLGAVLGGQVRPSPDAHERGISVRHALGDLGEKLVAHHPPAGLVDLGRKVLAPSGNLARHAHLATRQRAHTLDLAVGLARVVAIALRVAGVGEVVFQPCSAAEFLETGAHRAPDAGQVAHIVEGVGDLLGIEGAGRPVGQGLGLGQVHVAEVLNKGAVADLIAVGNERGGHLRVEDGAGKGAAPLLEHFHVLRTGVEDLGDGGVLEKSHQGLHILHAEGIDRYLLVVGAKLHEAQTRPIGLLAQELGVDGQDLAALGAGAKIAELLVGGDKHCLCLPVFLIHVRAWTNLGPNEKGRSGFPGRPLSHNGGRYKI